MQVGGVEEYGGYGLGWLWQGEGCHEGVCSVVDVDGCWVRDYGVVAFVCSDCAMLILCVEFMQL